MCDVVSEKAKKMPGTGVCVCACLGADRVLGWKKFSNQLPGRNPDCFTNTSCEIQSTNTGNSVAGKCMKQI